MCEARVQRWLVENKRVVILSAIVSLGFVLVVTVAVLSGRGGSAPDSGGEKPTDCKRMEILTKILITAGEWGGWSPWTECEGEVSVPARPF